MSVLCFAAELLAVECYTCGYDATTGILESCLDPFTAYEFKLTARNAAGTGESDWVEARTLETCE